MHEIFDAQSSCIAFTIFDECHWTKGGLRLHKAAHTIRILSIVEKWVSLDVLIIEIGSLN